MQVQAIPLTDFMHGTLHAQAGHPVMIEEHTAIDLERAGLVRVKLAPPHLNKMVQPSVNKEEAGKAPDDGQGQPSSASPADPASPREIPHVYKRGSSKPPRTA